MQEVKVFKSLNNKFYNTKEECIIADKEYLIYSLFINKIYDSNLQSLFTKGRDEFWNELNKKIYNVIDLNIEAYISKTKIEDVELESKIDDVLDHSETITSRKKQKKNIING